MSNDGPIDEIGDLITGEAATPRNVGGHDRHRSSDERRREADEAAQEASYHPTSVNEPDGGLTMRDLADRSDADGRTQRGSQQAPEDADSAL